MPATEPNKYLDNQALSTHQPQQIHTQLIYAPDSYFGPCPLHLPYAHYVVDYLRTPQLPNYYATVLLGGRSESCAVSDSAASSQPPSTSTFVGKCWPSERTPVHSRSSNLIPVSRAHFERKESFSNKAGLRTPDGRFPRDRSTML